VRNDSDIKIKKGKRPKSYNATKDKTRKQRQKQRIKEATDETLLLNKINCSHLFILFQYIGKKNFSKPNYYTGL
jgi:hypothetical protein